MMSKAKPHFEQRTICLDCVLIIGSLSISEPKSEILKTFLETLKGLDAEILTTFKAIIYHTSKDCMKCASLEESVWE
jgi:hypothetical protein